MAVILLLEDDETISYGICAGLMKKGHQVLCCESLEKAREAFSPEVELALLDWNLPDGSGYRFCRELKEIRDIPIIFLTVRDDPQDIVRGLEAGADDYIVKPFLLSVLSARIQAVLRRSGTPAGAKGQEKLSLIHIFRQGTGRSLMSSLPFVMLIILFLLFVGLYVNYNLKKERGYIDELIHQKEEIEAQMCIRDRNNPADFLAICEEEKNKSDDGSIE